MFFSKKSIPFGSSAAAAHRTGMNQSGAESRAERIIEKPPSGEHAVAYQVKMRALLPLLGNCCQISTGAAGPPIGCDRIFPDFGLAKTRPARSMQHNARNSCRQRFRHKLFSDSDLQHMHRE